jgi:hypothetical protein
MGSNNNHEAITHLAMPVRQIPVLIDSSPEKAEGFVPSIIWSDKPVTSVRRLLPSFVEGLESPRKRKEIEKEHGVIDSVEWNRLRELLALTDRLNGGDWSPVVTSNAKEALEHFPALFDRMSPRRWFREDDQSNAGKLVFRSASGDKQMTIDIGEISRTPLGNAPPIQKAVKYTKPVIAQDGNSLTWNIPIAGAQKTVTFALSEAFTAGLSKTRFVVWWHDASKKFVPGLYCPDIVTALYALAMWSSGTAGGWAICQKCKKGYPRRRMKQFYCSSNCQVAAAMKRLRDRAKGSATSEAESGPKTEKRTERK